MTTMTAAQIKILGFAANDKAIHAGHYFASQSGRLVLSPIAAPTIAALVRRGMLVELPGVHDRPFYAITDAGRAALAAS